MGISLRARYVAPEKDAPWKIDVGIGSASDVQIYSCASIAYIPLVLSLSLKYSPLYLAGDGLCYCERKSLQRFVGAILQKATLKCEKNIYYFQRPLVIRVITAGRWRPKLTVETSSIEQIFDWLAMPTSPGAR